jgi:hypothetical protein
MLEKEAYAETMRADFQQRGPESFTLAYENWIVSQFVGPAYFWMWAWKPSIRKWYRSTKTLVINGF